MRSAVFLWLVFTAAAAEDVAGLYRLEGTMETASELRLKPDGTFEYGLIYGAADYSATGAWKLDGGAVVLNSTPTGAPFRLARSASIAGEVRINVKTAHGRPVQRIDVKLETEQGEVTGVTDPQGIATFPGVKHARAVILHVPVYDVTSESFRLDPGRNDFHFELNGEAITRVPFKNERLEIKGTTLEMRYWNKQKPMRYRKS